MSQTISTSIQRTIALALTGASVGISYTTLFVESRTQHKLLGRLVNAARYVAHLTCNLGLFLNLHLTAAYFTFTLVMVQLYHGIMGYLLVHRINSILPWARDTENFIPYAFAFVVALVLVPAVCALRKQMVIIGITAIATMIELALRIFALTATYVAIDFYIKMLCISLDTHAFTSLGVCLSDVLTKGPSRSNMPKGGSSSITGGGAVGNGGGGNSNTIVPPSSLVLATRDLSKDGRRSSQQPIMLQRE
ncbi:hypothetical protein BCR44DRAFT_1539941 [Catenaria anguillulae PL171]|uniref:Uncharacterized protein n=1 Tax=Catenaria anguillulae PL171 TaxID=765915 RepID=A0A1Y2HX91_9FUNG|nr:hypothetical protein BCR44DRAFT_1539941 [Catenaria anguillulae PL171]